MDGRAALVEGIACTVIHERSDMVYSSFFYYPYLILKTEAQRQTDCHIAKQSQSSS